MNHLAVTLPLLLAALAVTGCATRRDHTKLLEGIPTKLVTLEPRNTKAPTLTLRVPTEFEVEWTANAATDAFVIYNPDDEAEVQRGMLVVNVTPGPVSHIADTLKTGHSRSTLAGATIEWREHAFEDDDGNRVHQREAIHDKMFGLFKDPKSGRELMLQVLAVGSDSVLVERLMGSAETIVAASSRPDV